MTDAPATEIEMGYGQAPTGGSPAAPAAPAAPTAPGGLSSLASQLAGGAPQAPQAPQAAPLTPLHGTDSSAAPGISGTTAQPSGVVHQSGQAADVSAVGAFTNPGAAAGVNPNRMSQIMAAIGGTPATPAAETPATASPAAGAAAANPNIEALLGSQTLILQQLSDRLTAGATAPADGTEQPATYESLITGPGELDSAISARFNDTQHLRQLIQHEAHAMVASLLTPVTKRIDADLSNIGAQHSSLNDTLQSVRNDLFTSSVSTLDADMQELSRAEAAPFLDAADPMSGHTPRQLLAAAQTNNDASALRRITQHIAGQVRQATQTPTPHAGQQPPRGATPTQPSTPDAGGVDAQKQIDNLTVLRNTRQITEQEYLATKNQLMVKFL